MLIHDCDFRKSQDTGNNTFFYKYRHFDTLAHEKGIASIAPVSPTRNALRLVSGGLDRYLYLWEFERDGREFKCQVGKTSLHKKHTSAVQAVYYDKKADTVYSGGVDW